MSLVIVLIFIVHILLTTRSLTYGLCSYIAIRLLIPAGVRLPINVSLNTMVLCVLFLFVLIKYRAKIFQIFQDKLSKKILICSMGLLICTLISPLSFNTQLSAFAQFITTEILPCISVFLIIKNKHDLKLLIYTILGCSLISGIYGIYTYIVGGNPYFIYMITNYGDINSLEFDFSEFTRERGGITGYAAGMTSGGALIWSQTVLLIGLFFWKRTDYNKYIITLVCFLMLINSVLAGQRSSLLGFIVALIIIYYKSISIKKLLITFFAFITLLITLEYIPSLNNYKKTIYSTIFFWDDSYSSKNDIGGSSVKLRAEQLEATLNMLEEYPLGGMGFGYPNSKEGEKTRKVMFGYESIFFNVAWSSGLIGCLIWFILFRGIYQSFYLSNRKKRKGDKEFFIAYCISILLTAIQSTFFLFLIFVFISKKENEYLKTNKK